MNIVITVPLGFVAFYNTLGQFLIRYFYTKCAYYRIVDTRIEIIIRIFKWEYVRRFLLEDITVIERRNYKRGIGSIHFGDAENKLWNSQNGYEGKRKPLVTGGGLLRRNNKYHSGILYSISNVEQVYELLKNIQTKSRLELINEENKNMSQEGVHWEGKCEKVHFFKEDIIDILMSIVIICILYQMQDLNIGIGLLWGFVALYQMFGQFLIRYFYTKHVHYRILDTRIEIIIRIFKWKYVKKFMLKDITSIERRVYKNGIGNIYFEDVENRWQSAGRKYKEKRKPSVIEIGTLRRNHILQNGILYSISNVEQVYRLLKDIIE